MKRLLPPISTVVFLLVSSFAAAQTPPPAAPQTLSLQEAVRIALEKNPTVQAAEAYSDAVEQGIREAKAGRLPRVDFSEGFTRGNNPVYVFGTLLTQRQFTAADFALNKLNAPTPVDNFRTQFSASMPLYDAGQISRQVKDAKLNVGAACEFVWMGDMPVDQGSDANTRGRVSGSFSDAWISFFTLNLTYKF